MEVVKAGGRRSGRRMTAVFFFFLRGGVFLLLKMLVFSLGVVLMLGFVVLVWKQILETPSMW